MTKREFTPEHRAKISEAAKRRPRRTLTEEHRAKISASAIARYEDPAQRAQQSEIQKSKDCHHGKVGSGAYVSWYAMKQRCTNPKNRSWDLYGGRGVTYAPAWESFQAFYADMGDRPPNMTLERIDTNGNYEPGNCQWATWSEQRRNQRRMQQ